jgi:hypothetical protein
MIAGIVLFALGLKERSSRSTNRRPRSPRWHSAVASRSTS